MRSAKGKLFSPQIILQQSVHFIGLCNNHLQNILRLFDILTKFSFTTSEKMHNYYY